jgi:uncharacterized protein YdhG (YjbR/CyaY superfamily)
LTSNKPKAFNDYLIGFDEEVQLRLEEIRNAILKQFPDAEESIRYNIPAFLMNGVHIYFSAYKKHIGMYPFYMKTEIENEIENYRGKGTKDALHFLNNKPLPLDLILKLVEYKFNQKVK